MKILHLLGLWLIAGSVLAQPVDTALLHGLKFRSIGPAQMSGRVTSIDVVERDPNILYVGTSAGSLWKSVNAGTTYEPVFENQRCASIGDLAIYQKNPNILYLGTGEGNPRNSQSDGTGMYKSLDGGVTWIHLGLELSRSIDKVIVHPDNPDIVWAGVQGADWGDSEQRGVYKSTDGGQTWGKILYTNPTTGVADMVMDPSNPNKLMVAMWDFRRWPWFMRSGGVGSAIHVTHDGGAHWQKLDAATCGLPGDTLGKIGLAIAPSRPEVVYALVETRAENALFRSEDGGGTFKKTTAKGVGGRPFYYMDLAVDPKNENRVYEVSGSISVSEDGGKNFRVLVDAFSGVHVDHHAFWIDPDDPGHMMDGNDGGLYTSFDMGRNWRFQQNLPVAQYYHINVDMEIPYYVYGGMQDNGSWCGPAYRFISREGIRNWDFENIGFGDGFDVVPDPKNSRFGYSMSQGGAYQRYDRLTGVWSSIKPRHPEGVKLRFNWNAAFAMDPFDQHTIYGGSQFVHKSTDEGRSWTIISPDLTTNDPAKQKQNISGGFTIDNTNAENHCCILVIEPSSIEEGLIWVGTDDGRIQLTRDGGKNWTDVTANLKGVEPNSWVAQIKHSVHHKGEAFVVIEDHRRNNWTPYLFHTLNYGKTWEPMVDEQDVWGFTLSVVQDPVEEKLMFLGTDFGLYFSLDGGKNWHQWTRDFPTVAVTDMVIHPKEYDLVVGTFGRSAYILDDIRPLRALAADPGILEKDLYLFPPPPAYLGVEPFHNFFAGAQESYTGQNRPVGALLSFYSGADRDSITIAVRDDTGKLLKELKSPVRSGINRLAWDLKTEGCKLPGEMDEWAQMAMGGAPLFFGEYRVTLEEEPGSARTLQILKDPRTPVSDAELKENIRRKEAFNQLAGRLTDAYNEVAGAIASMDQARSFVSVSPDLMAEMDSLKTKADKLKYIMIPKISKGILGETPDLKSQFMSLSEYYSDPMATPEENSAIVFKALEGKVENLEAETGVFTKEYKAFKEKVNSSDVMQWK